MDSFVNNTIYPSISNSKTYIIFYEPAPNDQQYPMSNLDY